MTQRPIVFLDLDNTLFHSARKIAGDPALHEPVAFNRDGKPISYMTAGQRAFYRWLSRDAEIVPTTGRNLAAYRRVNLPFGGHAILSHGGLIVDPNGEPDPVWLERMRNAAQTCAGTLARLREQALSAAEAHGVDVRATIVGDYGIDLYCSVKHNGDDGAALGAFAPALRALLADGWQMHLNDTNLALMPPFLSKAAAVRYFLDNLAEPPPFVLGAGDSLSDLPFMACADLAMMPTRSQVFRTLLERCDAT